MDIRKKYLEFFERKGHKVIPSAPVIPENDPTTLFNTAGMQPLVPYFTGKPHPDGKRLVDYQKCIRLVDLENIGDKTHHTFFEMLGNWSLGDYFKKESIAYSFELLTKEFNIPIERLAVTVFQGNDIVPRDEESATIWKEQGIPEERIAYLGEEDNWWGLEVGPCGPDTEIFYWSDNTTPAPTKFDPEENRWVEIWNNVFMEYNKTKTGEYIPLEQKNVDTGMGYERIVAALEGVDDNYSTTVWKEVIEEIKNITGLPYNEETAPSMRIIADHIRTSIFISGDDAGIIPSNTDQGYILRRLIRRAIRHAKKLNIDIITNWEERLANVIINKYKEYYLELDRNYSRILEVLKNEKVKFNRTLEKGLREFEKIVNSLNSNELGADLSFKLYDTYGFPIELTKELAIEKGFKIDLDGFYTKFKEHQEKSRAGSTSKFKGGLASTGDMPTKYHTATHLLNAALKEVLGPEVHQKGSNITEERMRFDFSFDRKMTPEEIKQTEDLVNTYINQAIDVTVKEMSKEEALKTGAEAMFIDKYGDMVTVYYIGDTSKELCGGPHVDNTSKLGRFKIKKEEASSAGVRRIKAILIDE